MVSVMNKHYALALSKTKRQSGVVLIISLIMLLALTMIGITSSSVTGLEEKMVANSKDVNLAFQAAEATLRAAEDGLNTKPTFDCSASNANQGVDGYYTLLNNDGVLSSNGTLTSPPTLKAPAPAPPFYSAVDWDGTKVITYNNVVSGGKKLVGLYQAPKYIIEELSNVASGSTSTTSLEGGIVKSDSAGSVVTFRITAHGWGSNGNSVATVQSIVKVTYLIATRC